MTIRKVLEVETISLLFIAAIVGSVMVWYNNYKFEQKFKVVSPLVSNDLGPKIISPTVNPTLQVETASQISPDGTKMVHMKAVHNSDNTYTYTFSDSDALGENEVQLLSQTVPESEKMSIPFNTWSPDNKYVWIQDGKNALMFLSSGDPLATDSAYLNVTDLFSNAIHTSNFYEATGWSSPTLFIINTIKDNNTRGSSYWFELPSKRFIPLATLF